MSNSAKSLHPETDGRLKQGSSPTKRARSGAFQKTNLCKDGTEEFRYELVNVTRNKLLFSQSGAQKAQLYRLDKTDIIYQYRTVKIFTPDAATLNTSLSNLRGYGPHLHTVKMSSNVVALTQINTSTDITASHQHAVVNGVVLPILGHTHQIIFV